MLMKSIISIVEPEGRVASKSLLVGSIVSSKRKVVKFVVGFNFNMCMSLVGHRCLFRAHLIKFSKNSTINGNIETVS